MKPAHRTRAKLDPLDVVIHSCSRILNNHDWCAYTAVPVPQPAAVTRRDSASKRIVNDVVRQSPLIYIRDGSRACKQRRRKLAAATWRGACSPQPASTERAFYRHVCHARQLSIAQNYAMLDLASAAQTVQWRPSHDSRGNPCIAETLSACLALLLRANLKGIQLKQRQIA